MENIQTRYIFVSIAIIFLGAIILNWFDYDARLIIDKITRESNMSSVESVDDQNQGLSKKQANDLSKPSSVVSVELIPVEVESDSSISFPQAPLIRNKDFTTASGNKIRLQLQDDSEILSIEADAAGEHFLVAQGSPRMFSVYDFDGKFVVRLPQVAQALPELKPRTQFNWKWANENNLVASLGFIHEVVTNHYPESDTSVYDMRLFTYNLKTTQLR